MDATQVAISFSANPSGFPARNTPPSSSLLNRANLETAASPASKATAPTNPGNTDKTKPALEAQKRATQKYQPQAWPLGGPDSREVKRLNFGPSDEYNLLTRSYDAKGKPQTETSLAVELFKSQFVDWMA